MMRMKSFDNLRKILMKERKKARKRAREIRKFRKYNFSEEMINDLNDYFTRHYGAVEFYLPYPMGHGVEGTELYQIFKKYNKEKLLKRKLFRKIKINFPIVWNIKEGTYHIDLED